MKRCFLLGFSVLLATSLLAVEPTVAPRKGMKLSEVATIEGVVWHLNLSSKGTYLDFSIGHQGWDTNITAQGPNRYTESGLKKVEACLSEPDSTGTTFTWVVNFTPEDFKPSARALDQQDSPQY